MVFDLPTLISMSNQAQHLVVAKQIIKEPLEKYGIGRDWSEFL
jgi:hypothetical protein